MDNDIVQGEEGHHTDDKEGETERLPVKKNSGSSQILRNVYH